MPDPDFTSYAVASRYAVQINEGYSACLHGLPCVCHLEGDQRAAWMHGYRQALAHMKRQVA